MKKMMLLALCGSLFSQAFAQDKCATQLLLQQALRNHPERAAAREHFREHSAAQAELYEKLLSQMKTTANEKIPVVFHVVVTQAQLNFLGGNSGVLQRAMDQINVLNEDFNGTNADKVKTPAAFAGLAGNASLTFGLAHRNPGGQATNGVEIKTTTTTGFSVFASNGSLPKAASSGGFDPWDPQSYLNIWIVNISESTLLGYTVPPSFIGSGYSLQEIGLVIDYGAFGRRMGSIQNFSPSVNDKGRTITHETGHFFELDHTFGGGAGCPGSGDYDDNITDTPPQNNPTYNGNFSGNMVPFPLTDACTPSSPGIMWMNFMDYTDDSSMYLFTKGQVNSMRSKLGSGVLQSLTQHPELLDWPTAVAQVDAEAYFSVYPNPGTGLFHISFDGQAALRKIEIVNIMGQTVRSIGLSNPGISDYDVDLTGMSKGVYMVRCTFATGIITKKIVLQ